MRSLSSDVIAAIEAGEVVLAQLVFLDLSEPVYLNTTGWDLQWDGETWRGANGLGTIREISDAPGEIKPLEFELSGVPTETLAVALAEPLQGRTVEIRTAIFHVGTYAVLDAPIEWAGWLDDMRVVERDGQAVIAVSAEHVGIDLLRGRVLRYSNTDQQLLFPGDRGCEYMTDQAEQSIVWPAAGFFKK